MKATTFVFGPYRADFESGKLEFDYVIEFSDAEPLKFTEKIVIPPLLLPLSKGETKGGVMSKILNNLSLILGISYYKLYVPPKVELPLELTEEQAEFWNTVYRKGLGEFWYTNNLAIPKRVLSAASPPPGARRQAFRASGGGPPLPPPADRHTRILLGIGGGKDSIVAAELLKKEGVSVTGFVVETERGSEIIDEVVPALEIPLLKIRRTLDPKLFQPHSGSYNGHVPVSAIYAWLGLLLAVLHDMDWLAVGNEFSSDFGNLEYKGEMINHQWSKSGEFEKLFQEYVKKYVTHDVTYFSLLRPFYEMRVAKILVELPIWENIKVKFSSCNRNFLHHPPSPELRRGKWCGECPKCAFVFAMLAAFLPKREVIEIFGKNLYADQNLIPLYKDLLGEGTMKPFDCVGTFAEMRAGLWRAREKFKGDIVIQEFANKIEVGARAWEEVMRVQTAPTLPERFRLAGVERVLILGYGREGKVTEKFLRKFYPGIEIGIADQTEGKDYLERQKDFDMAVKTPGIPRRLVTVPYTTATNTFFSRVQNLIIGVTGSKGKSTTASLIAAMLKAGGKKVELLGNIGKPMLEALLSPINPEIIFVLELSSQQLEDMKVSPPVAVLTSLFPEHMDYHGSVEAYYEAKMNIAKFQEPSDVFIREPDNIPVPDGELPLLGEHNRHNLGLAVAVARYFSVADDQIAEAIKSFKPLPHRQEFLGEFRGIRFYDNASSTTPESTIAALKALSEVETIFLGGLDRGYNFQGLASEIQSRQIGNAVLFPDTGARIKPLLPAHIRVLETESMEEAVKFAYAHTSAGKTVLLSAASPSYSVWANFNEQGDEFKKWVKALV